jgi:hypothetical protein
MRIRIKIREGKNDLEKKEKSEKMACFEALDVLL